MGMPIEDIIGELESTKDYPASDPASDEALDCAIDIMRKYQKIEQILKDIPYGGDATVRRIQEVVEDGNKNKS